MKKLIALLPFILVSCFGSSTQSFAITYGGGSTFSLPDIVNTGVTLASTTIISEYETKSQVIDSANTVYSYLGCAELENGMSGITLMTFRNYSQASSGGPYGVWAEVNLKIDQIVSGTNSGKSIIYMEGNGLYSDDDFSRVAITYVPSIHNSYLGDTTKGLFCFNPVIFQRNGGGLFDVNDGLYIQNISYTYYSGPTGRYGFGQIDYSSLHFGLGAQIFKRVAAESSPPYWLNYTRLEMYGNTSLNTKIWYQYDPLISTVSIFDFLSTLTGSNIDQTIPQFLSMVSSTGSIFDSSYAPIGTGSTDYFVDCTSFLDVGCYVQGAFNGIVDKFKNFFSSIWSWLIPDFNINWNGTTSSCATYEGGTGSTLTITSNSGSIGILQNFANLVSLVTPFAPIDGSTVCLLDGSVKTIDYKSDTVNFFDILIIIFCIFPILFASHHDHHKKP